jgi:hypothetical protein
MNMRGPSGEPPLMKVLFAATLVAASACGSSTSPPAEGNTDAGGDASSSAPGSATIGGSAGMSAFATAASVWAIDGTDDPANLVVYVFSKAVACSEIQSPGWDGPTALGRDPSLQFLEIKYKSQTIQPFTVVAGPNFGAGEALSNHTLVGRTPSPELDAHGGSAATTSLVASSHASGTFDIQFGTAESLAGSYDAPFCAGGSEP